MAPRRRGRQALSFLPAAALLLAACGGSGGDRGNAGGAGATQAAAVEISGFAFHPATVTVQAGAKVTWTNSDKAPHTATGVGGTSFDTGTLERGQSGTVTLAEPGTYRYFCRFHPFMRGTIVVR